MPNAKPRMMGLQEIADHFGVKKQLVYKWASRPTFPEPYQELHQGRIWTRESIMAWGRRNGRKAGQGPLPYTQEKARAN